MTTAGDPWGVHTLSSETVFLRALVGLGISRGEIGKRIRNRWKAKYSTLIDAEIRGIKYRLDISNNPTDEKILLSSKFKDKKEIDALCAGKLGVFVDVGANTGYYTLSCAKRGFQRILSVEANPTTVSRLSFNVGINPWQDRVTIIPLCVGGGGKIPFYFSGGLGNASLIKPREDIPPIFVESKPLFQILSENSISVIDAMKIDIEGYEDQALLPFFSQAPETMWPKVVVIEDCHRDEWKRDVLEEMLKIGYAVKDRTRGNQILIRA